MAPVSLGNSEGIQKKPNIFENPIFTGKSSLFPSGNPGTNQTGLFGSGLQNPLLGSGISTSLSNGSGLFGSGLNQNSNGPAFNLVEFGKTSLLGSNPARGALGGKLKGEEGLGNQKDSFPSNHRGSDPQPFLLNPGSKLNDSEKQQTFPSFGGEQPKGLSSSSLLGFADVQKPSGLEGNFIRPSKFMQLPKNKEI